MSISRKDVLSLFWILALIFFLRAFLFEPFQIPTGSMIPTLLVGDHLLVAKSAYDINIPLTRKTLLRVSDPQSGDIIVFDYPNVENDLRKNGFFYIKRIVGVPGDLIIIKNGALLINGQSPLEVKIDRASPEAKSIPNFSALSHADLYQETLRADQRHWIQKYPASYERYLDDIPRYRVDSNKNCMEIGVFMKERRYTFYRSIAANELCEFTVPANQYFVMGDNRDDSEDGRFWGFVDRHKIKGKALMIFMAMGRGSVVEFTKNSPLEANASYFNWKRFGLKIK